MLTLQQEGQVPSGACPFLLVNITLLDGAF